MPSAHDENVKVWYAPSTLGTGSLKLLQLLLTTVRVGQPSGSALRIARARKMAASLFLSDQPARSFSRLNKGLGSQC